MTLDDSKIKIDKQDIKSNYYLFLRSSFRDAFNFYSFLYFISNQNIDDSETNAVRAKIISLREAIHQQNEEEVKKRWHFEDSIKRPYFHVKPLERMQLRNWREYLDFEMKENNHKQICVLFERCLIACALYEEFWQKVCSFVLPYVIIISIILHPVVIPVVASVLILIFLLITWSLIFFPSLPFPL